MPSALARPSMIGQVRGLLVMARLSCKLAMLPPDPAGRLFICAQNGLSGALRQAGEAHIGSRRKFRHILATNLRRGRKRRMIGGDPPSVFAVGAFHTLVALLRLEAQRRDWPRIEPPYADRLVGFFAITVRPVLDPLQRFVDLLDELA